MRLCATITLIYAAFYIQCLSLPGWAETTYVVGEGADHYSPLSQKSGALDRDLSRMGKGRLQAAELLSLTATGKDMSVAQASTNEVAISSPMPSPTVTSGFYTPLEVVGVGMSLTDAQRAGIELYIRQLPPEHTRAIEKVEVISGPVGNSFLSGNTLKIFIVNSVLSQGEPAVSQALFGGLRYALADYTYNHVLTDAERLFLLETYSPVPASFLASFLFVEEYHAYRRDTLVYFDDAVEGIPHKLKNPRTLQYFITLASLFANAGPSVRTFNEKTQTTSFDLSITRDESSLNGITLLNIGKHHFLVENDRIIGYSDQDIYRIGVNKATFVGWSPAVKVSPDSLKRFALLKIS